MHVSKVEWKEHPACLTARAGPGYVRSCGLVISVYPEYRGGGMAEIRPITSKGACEQAYVEMPASKLRELAGKLLEAARKLEEGGIRK